MRLPVEPETIVAEMKAAQAILDKWIREVEGGLPVIDLPTGTQEQLEDFIRALSGELLIVTAKCESLSNVLSGNT